MDKEQYKQRLHTLVQQLKAQEDKELLDYLQLEVNSAILTNPTNTDTFIKLQRKNMRKKVRYSIKK